MPHSHLDGNSLSVPIVADDSSADSLVDDCDDTRYSPLVRYADNTDDHRDMLQYYHFPHSEDPDCNNCRGVLVVAVGAGCLSLAASQPR